MAYTLEEDPSNLQEALSSLDADLWQEAINDEMDFLESNKTWHLVYLPPSCKPIGCKWILKKKLKPDGTVDKYKARLVAKGFRQRENVDFFDTFSPVTRITSIWLLISLAAIYSLVVHQMDFKTAFLNGELEEEIYMEQPEGFVIHGQEDKVCKLDKSLFINRPSMEHWHTIERVMRYLKRTINLGLHYKRFPVVLEEYNNADWNTLSDDSKVTSDYIFSIAGGTVSWKSKKQTILAQSTMESEMIALATTSKEASWLRSLLAEIPLWERPIPAVLIHCDSTTAIAKIENCYYNADDKKLVHKVDLKLNRCTLCHNIDVTQRYNVIMDFPLTIDLNRLLEEAHECISFVVCMR
ncbi:Retrovirus-related Pol polyprotein from transposon TNT 1-94 [Glycine soja]|uniref:Retrovirus-related Pol polyprotein from transposon TNT 1-94 n=1 Tax=Glycine soja TaxID=3848 RepID=A0A445IL28_GLYSO|nr:Retrovirus-related Pol polyprotein from transposon TNT 1-94 [Glycine soja]